MTSPPRLLRWFLLLTLLAGLGLASWWRLRPQPLRVALATVEQGLVERLVADARAEGGKIIPLCPYVQLLYTRNPDWADVFTTAPGEKPDLPR